MKMFAPIMSGLLQSLGLERGLLVILCTLFLWLVVVGCAISSVFAQPIDRKQRIFWIALILGLPLVGLLAYLPFSVRRANHPMLFQSKN